MSPEQRERVRRIQERLDARGLQNIAFDIKAGLTCPPSRVIADVCEALEAFLDGRIHRLPPFGDSQRKFPEHACQKCGGTWFEGDSTEIHCKACNEPITARALSSYR